MRKFFNFLHRGLQLTSRREKSFPAEHQYEREKWLFTVKYDAERRESTQIQDTRGTRSFFFSGDIYGGQGALFRMLDEIRVLRDIA